VKNGGVKVIVAEEMLTQVRKFDAREADILAELTGDMASNMRDQGRKAPPEPRRRAHVAAAPVGPAVRWL